LYSTDPTVWLLQTKSKSSCNSGRLLAPARNQNNQQVLYVRPKWQKSVRMGRSI